MPLTADRLLRFARFVRGNPDEIATFGWILGVELPLELIHTLCVIDAHNDEIKHVVAWLTLEGDDRPTLSPNFAPLERELYNLRARLLELAEMGS